MSDSDTRPDRQVLLELTALLEELIRIRIRDSGDRARFDADQHYRWLLHRMWIAVGNEAHACAQLAGQRLDNAAVTRQPAQVLVSCVLDTYPQTSTMARRRYPEVRVDQPRDGGAPQGMTNRRRQEAVVGEGVKERLCHSPVQSRPSGRVATEAASLVLGALAASG